jgi:hypothetical protein
LLRVFWIWSGVVVGFEDSILCIMLLKIFILIKDLNFLE